MRDFKYSDFQTTGTAVASQNKNNKLAADIDVLMATQRMTKYPMLFFPHLHRTL